SDNALIVAQVESLVLRIWQREDIRLQDCSGALHEEAGADPCNIRPEDGPLFSQPLIDRLQLGKVALLFLGLLLAVTACKTAGAIRQPFAVSIKILGQSTAPASLPTVIVSR